jgi:putative glutamine amidotransferase
MSKPIVLVSACTRSFGDVSYHAVQEKYVEAAAAAGCAPLLLPALGPQTDVESVLSAAHGVLLTGSSSNVHPARFGQPPLDPALPLDAARDATVLPLMRTVLARGLPLFAICRGAQEINVALGGSLHQAVHALPGMMDHRENTDAARPLRYGPAHRVTLERDGMLAAILGGRQDILVNSLHGQGLDRLASGLAVEARADDGLIEAFRVADAPGFALAVQWHPEWQSTQNPVSVALFGAFGDACRGYLRQARDRRRHPYQPGPERVP